MNFDDIKRLEQEKEYMKNNPDIFDTETIKERLIIITKEIQDKAFSKHFLDLKIPPPQVILEFLIHFGDFELDFYDKNKTEYCIFLLKKYYPYYLKRRLNINIRIENYEACALIKEWSDIEVNKMPILPNI